MILFTKNTSTTGHVNQCFILQNAIIVGKDTDYCSSYITFFSYFLFLRSLSSLSLRNLSLISEKNGSLLEILSLPPHPTSSRSCHRLAATKTIFCRSSPHQTPRVIWVLFWEFDLDIIWLLFLSLIWFGGFSLWDFL